MVKIGLISSGLKTPDELKDVLGIDRHCYYQKKNVWQKDAIYIKRITYMSYIYEYATSGTAEFVISIYYLFTN